MSSAIYLLKNNATNWAGTEEPKCTTFTYPNGVEAKLLKPNQTAKLLTTLALGDLVILIAALAIGILGVLGMTHVMNMPSEMVYAFAGVGFVAIPYAILLIKNTTLKGGFAFDGDVKYDLNTIRATMRWACSLEST